MESIVGLAPRHQLMSKAYDLSFFNYLMQLKALNKEEGKQYKIRRTSVDTTFELLYSGRSQSVSKVLLAKLKSSQKTKLSNSITMMARRMGNGPKVYNFPEMNNSSIL